MDSVTFQQWSFHSLFAVCILVSGTVLVNACNEEDIDRCWEPMVGLPDHLTWDSIVPSLTEENMREHCRLYEEVEDCLKILNCGTLLQAVHYGLERAYHFLCEEAFDEYLQHRVCFNDTRLHAEGDHCNHTLVTKLDSLDTSETVQYRFARICQYANDYLDCVENAVRSFCGQDAGAWQRELDYRTLTPLLSKTGCILDSNNRLYYPQEEDKTKTYIIIGCVVALSVIILLIFIALFIMLRNKKKAASQRQRDSAHSPQMGMEYMSDTNLPPGADGVHLGPLPMKEPPPYDETPPDYTPYEMTSRDDQPSVMGASSPYSVVNDDVNKSEYFGNGRAPSTTAGSVYAEGRAPSKAGSVYAEGRAPSKAGSVYAEGRAPSKAGSVYAEGWAPSKAGSVYSVGQPPSSKSGPVYPEGSRRSRGHPDNHTRGQNGTRSNHSKKPLRDDYF